MASEFKVKFTADSAELDKTVVTTQKGIQKVGDTAVVTSEKTNKMTKSVGRLTTKFKALMAVGIVGLIAGLINAGKSLFTFNKELTKTTKLVEDLTGKTGDDLVKFTAQVQAVSDVFEQDFNEILISANTVATEFGITQEEALEKITKGLQDGSNASNQFLDILKEYPTQLKAVGLTADETFAIINQQVTEGVYSDKGVDAIKEAGLRLREMPEATQKALEGIGLSSKEIERGLKDGTRSIFDVIQTVSTRLDTLPPQSAKVGAAIADIFGGPGEDAGLRYLTTLKDINLETATQNKELTDTQKLQKQQVENQERINTLMAQFFGESNTGFSQIIADLTTISLDLIVGMIDGVKNTIRFFEDLSDKSKGFRLIVNSIGGAFQLLWSQVKSILRLMGEGFKSLGGIIEGVFTLDTDKVKESFKSFGDAVKQEVIVTFEKINEVREGIEDEFNTSNEEKRKQRVLERREAQKQEVAETTKAINEIQTNAIQIQNDKNNEQVRKASEQRLKITRDTAKQETEILKNAQQDQQANTLANSLANVDITKNAGSQILNVFKGEAIGALIKSILASLPFPINAIVAGGAGAIVNSLFNSLPKFQDGGIVPGNSFSGDQVLARVNSGEAILNEAQQNNIMTLANGGGNGTNKSIDNLAMKIDNLTNEVVFSEKNVTVENIIDVTPTDFLQVTEQGTRDRAVRAGTR